MPAHVQSPDGVARFWLEPGIAVAQNLGLKGRSIFEALRLVREQEQEIRRA